MTAHIYEFVLLVVGRVFDKVFHVMLEPLPLSLCAGGIELVIRGVRAIEETEVRSDLGMQLVYCSGAFGRDIHS